MKAKAMLPLLPDLASAAATRALAPLRIAIRRTWVYRRLLQGQLADHFTVQPYDTLPRRLEDADAMLRGRFRFHGETVDVKDGESITDAISRVLDRYGLRPKAIWAGEHAYLIYNRRFGQMQAIGVFAAEVDDAAVRLDPAEHSEFAWLSREQCLDRVHYRGLKDGLRSVHEYITGVNEPANELCLYRVPSG